MVLNSNPWFYHEAYGVSLQTWRWNPHNVSAVKICSVLSETKVPPLEPMVWSVIFLRKSTCHWGYAGVNKQCQLSKNQNHFKQVLSIFSPPFRDKQLDSLSMEYPKFDGRSSFSPWQYRLYGYNPHLRTPNWQSPGVKPDLCELVDTKLAPVHLQLRFSLSSQRQKKNGAKQACVLRWTFPTEIMWQIQR